MVVVAQLVRALVCGAGGRGFESHQSPIKKVEELIAPLFYLIYFCSLLDSHSFGIFPGISIIFSKLLSNNTMHGVVI